MTLYRGYQPAAACTGGPSPGSKALMAWFLGAFGSRGGKNLGIYNCRSVAGSSTTSLHGEGRACDLGINPHGAAYGDWVAEQLRLNSAELGIQCVIWKRRIWSGSYPDAGWRPYTGVADHLDHIHTELTRAAAQTLTADRVHAVLSGSTTSTTRGFLMALNDAQQAIVFEACQSLLFGIAGKRPAGQMALAVADVQQNVAALRSQVAGLQHVDSKAIATEVADAIVAAGIAGPVIDELSRRLGP